MLSRAASAPSRSARTVASSVPAGARPAAAARENESPARSWTGPSCRSAATRRRSSDDDSRAASNSRSRSRRPSRRRRAVDQASGSWISHSNTSDPATTGSTATTMSRPLAAMALSRW